MKEEKGLQVFNFNEGNKTLFTFKWNNKMAVIAPELMSFEGYESPRKAWLDSKLREGFEENCEFCTLQGEILKEFKAFLKESNDLVSLVTFGVTTLYEQYKSVPSLDIVFEEGIYGIMYNSGSNHATSFRKWMRRDVNTAITKNGNFDIIENEINKLEDAKEKELKSKIYQLENIIKLTPNDMLLVINYNNTKAELDTYLNSKKIEIQEKKIIAIEEFQNKLKEDTDLIKDQQKYVCNRTNFYEKVVILANKYFGRDKEMAYKALYGKIKLLGSFDVYSRRSNKLNEIQQERINSGKPPYAESTLKGKYNMLDVIDEHNKWELCSEAYKTVEMEMMPNKAI